MLLLRKFARDVSAVIGLVIVLATILVAALAPSVAPYPDDAFESHPLQRLQAPTRAFPFGTDNLGRDVFSRVLLGSRAALAVAVLVVGAAMVIGVPLGLVAGYYGGFVSDAIMRVTDVFLAVPQLILALALAQLLSPSLQNAMLALTLTYWPFFTRIVYAETRRLRVSVFVEALQGLNAGGFRIMFGHILPNAAPPIIIRATIGMGFTILSAAVLGFLGMGATPPDPEWGLTVAESRQYLPEAWWFATFPGLAIFLVVFGFNLLGDGLRDVVDPRLRRSR
ncbi:MAG TPA: ABC transporter permease [Methylomirabilota bacterium]|jgi:peptide/nickel transport system permease protein|nr:ABC transporter permease [Methylomirabilota bacterium]